MNASFAGMSVVMSCVWLSLVASEVVALLQTFGKVLNAPTVGFPVCQASFLLNESHQRMSSGPALIWRLGLDRQNTQPCTPY